MTRPPATLAVPAYADWITANNSTNRHWRHRHQLVAQWRDTTHLLARQHRVRHVTSPYTVTATVWVADARRRDVDGLTATVKACIDGLRAAGVLDDDDTRHMTSITTAYGGIDRDNPRLTLTIQETTP